MIENYLEFIKKKKIINKKFEIAYLFIFILLIIIIILIIIFSKYFKKNRKIRVNEINDEFFYIPTE